MTIDLLYTIIVCAILWISSVVIILLYIRLAWSRRISELEKYSKEYDWRLATAEYRYIRVKEKYEELRKELDAKQ